MVNKQIWDGGSFRNIRKLCGIIQLCLTKNQLNRLKHHVEPIIYAPKYNITKINISNYMSIRPNTIEIPFSYYGFWLGFSMDFPFVFVDIFMRKMMKSFLCIIVT